MKVKKIPFKLVQENSGHHHFMNGVSVPSLIITRVKLYQYTGKTRSSLPFLGLPEVANVPDYNLLNTV